VPAHDDSRPTNDAFADVLSANEAYADTVELGQLEARAARGLAVLTCMDSRIDPLAMLGLSRGDAKILRNAGARVTDDALRSVVLAVNLLGVDRVCVVAHTDCAMAGSTEDQVRTRVSDASGSDASGWTFLATTDQHQALRDDIARLRACDLLPDDLVIGGFVFDVHTGALVPDDDGDDTAS
jgi:carbonic anhydrase